MQSEIAANTELRELLLPDFPTNIEIIAKGAQDLVDFLREFPNRRLKTRTTSPYLRKVSTYFPATIPLDLSPSLPYNTFLFQRQRGFARLKFLNNSESQSSKKTASKLNTQTYTDRAEEITQSSFESALKQPQNKNKTALLFSFSLWNKQ